jgi:mannose-1-phosphate guanylyltransferase
MKAFVLCAGYGTRLGDYTREIPKPMLPICGEPLLFYTLRYLRDYGFNQVAINLHFKPEVITSYFGDGTSFGMELFYSYEEGLLGTAGAIKKIEEYFSDEDDFLVLYGDLLVDQDLAEMVNFHLQKKASATLLLHQRTGSNSLVQMDSDNQITSFIERPTEDVYRNSSGSHTWVNSGLQILNRKMMANIPDGCKADLPRDIYRSCLEKERLYGFPLTGYRCAIDSPERYEEAQAAVREGRYMGDREA